MADPLVVSMRLFYIGALNTLMTTYACHFVCFASSSGGIYEFGGFVVSSVTKQIVVLLFISCRFLVQQGTYVRS